MSEPLRGESNGPKRDRTADLYNAIVALSQLSYGPVMALEFRRSLNPCKYEAIFSYISGNCLRNERRAIGSQFAVLSMLS